MSVISVDDTKMITFIKTQTCYQEYLMPFFNRKWIYKIVNSLKSDHN